MKPVRSRSEFGLPGLRAASGAVILSLLISLVPVVLVGLVVPNPAMAQAASSASSEVTAEAALVSDTQAQTPDEVGNVRLTNRLLLGGTVVGTLLTLLSIVYGFLKINHATRGFYAGRLQTLAIAAAVVCLVLGYAFYATWWLN